MNKKHIYAIKRTSQFKKDFKLAIKRGCDIDKLEDAINILAEGKTLPKEYLDHELKCRYKNYRECHIEPNWLLVYRFFENTLILTLYRTGTHSDIF